MKAGAQTCVTHRVRKMAAVVRDRSSGGPFIAAVCRKSRNALASAGCAEFFVTATGFSMRIVASGTE